MNACPHCHAAVPAGARFCAQCGRTLSDSPPVSLQTPTPAGEASGPPPRTSGMAVAGLILSLIPVCLHAVGLVLGIVALVQIGRRPQELKGRGLALAAVIIGSLWTAVAPVGILAAIAIPNFIKFQGLSKQGEANTNLKSIYIASKSFESEYGRAPESFEELRFEPDASRRYAYFIDGEELQPSEGGPYDLSLSPVGFEGEDPPLAIAVGNVDSDDTLDVWVLGSDGVPRAVVDDVHNLR